MIKDLTDFTVICTWTTLHLANHLSLALTRPSVFMPACAKWQGASLYLIFLSMTRRCLREKQSRWDTVYAPLHLLYQYFCPSVFQPSCRPSVHHALHLFGSVFLCPISLLLFPSLCLSLRCQCIHFVCLLSTSLILSFRDSELNFCYSLCPLPLKATLFFLCFLCKVRLLILKRPAWLSEG